MFSVQKHLQCWFKCGIIKTIPKEVNRRTMTMSKRTTYIRYYFDRGEWRMTKDRCVLRTGRGLDSAIAAEKELRAAGIPVRFLFIEGWKIYCFFREKKFFKLSYLAIRGERKTNKMWCFYIKNRVTGKTDCVFGYSWEDAKKRYPSINNNEWYVEIKTYED